MKLNKEFFSRNADIVAKELLGKVLIRKINGKKLKARIVETEAYFSENDPASRACQNGDLRKTMLMKAGTILVYGVHNNWLVNFVTGNLEKAEAVLIRALEPLNFEGNCKGPGLLTKALGIDKYFHKKNLFSGDLWIEEPIKNKEKENFEIDSGFRIGVKKDLPEKLRFYIKNNKHVSKK
ncbi:DNA-3-methyladenine glycosylase [Candidatus Pacearchaeota archaeon]|nr:DNA-3-methyladenine glycosylase [Candidatus Pacearchaeota archaeon]